MFETNEHAKYTEMGDLLANDSLIFESGIVAKINQEAEFHVARFQIIMQLRAMVISEFRCGFEFHDDLFKADKVRHVHVGH